jgi:peptidoglycan/xylan/chitin deacetylase (PgdA/CDA1 family)
VYEVKSNESKVQDRSSFRFRFALFICKWHNCIESEHDVVSNVVLHRICMRLMRVQTTLHISLLLLSSLQPNAFPITALKTHRSPSQPFRGSESIALKSHNGIENFKATNRTMTLRTLALQFLWNSATWIGMRRLGRLLQGWFPNYYGDTLFCWEDCQPVQNYVALTIDDGLCRGEDNKKSMTSEIRELLNEYHATATFFACTDYITGELEVEALQILQDGHELGNHLKEDRSGYYCYLGKEDFRKKLLEAEASLSKTYNSYSDTLDNKRERRRWFRAPQGLMSKTMCQVVKEEGITSVLGDCYCDDWAFAEDGNVQPVAPIMLKQLQPGGSIAIFHMPQRGFREASLEALRAFLEGSKRRNMQCINLTEMAAKFNSSIDKKNM